MTVNPEKREAHKRLHSYPGFSHEDTVWFSVEGNRGHAGRGGLTGLKLQKSESHADALAGVSRVRPRRLGKYTEAHEISRELVSSLWLIPHRHMAEQEARGPAEDGIGKAKEKSADLSSCVLPGTCGWGSISYQ